MFSKRTHDYLEKNQIPHIYYIEPGVHDFKVWKNGLYMFSQLIFKPVDVSTFAAYPVVGAPAATNVRPCKISANITGFTGHLQNESPRCTKSAG